MGDCRAVRVRLLRATRQPYDTFWRFATAAECHLGILARGSARDEERLPVRRQPAISART